MDRFLVSWIRGAVILPFLLLLNGVFGQNDASLFPPKPEPAVYVHDYANWLTPDEKTRLEQKLVRYHDTTSTQIVVMIRADIGDYDKASYAFELGNRWGIGRKDKNNGVLMLIKTEQPQRGIFIATGYGTEGALPDILAGRIVREVMSPYFRQQQYFQGINAGVDNVIAALSGEFKADEIEAVEFPTWLFLLIFFGFIGLVFFIAWRSRKYAMYSGQGPASRRTIFKDSNTHGGWWIGGGGWGGGNNNDSGWGGGGWGDGGSFGGGGFGGGGAGGDW